MLGNLCALSFLLAHQIEAATPVVRKAVDGASVSVSADGALEKHGKVRTARATPAMGELLDSSHQAGDDFFPFAAIMKSVNAAVQRVQADAAAASKAKAAADAAAKAKAKDAAEAAAKLVSEAAAQAKADAEAAAKVVADARAKVHADVAADARAKVQADVEAAAKVVADAVAKAQADAEAARADVEAAAEALSHCFNGWEKRSESCTHADQGNAGRYSREGTQSECEEICQKDENCKGFSFRNDKVKKKGSANCFFFVTKVCGAGFSQPPDACTEDWCNYDKCQAHVLSVGELVVAKWPAFRGKTDDPWFAGKVAKFENSNRRACIDYEDGDKSCDVHDFDIRFAPNRDPKWGKGSLRGNDVIPDGALLVSFPQECQVTVYEHWPEGVHAGVLGLEAAEKTWNGEFPSGASLLLRGVGNHPLGSLSNLTSSVKVQGTCCKAYGFESTDCSGAQGSSIDSTTQLLAGLPAGIVTPATGLQSIWGCNDCAQCVKIAQQCP